jgi:hypothetical protein
MSRKPTHYNVYSQSGRTQVAPFTSATAAKEYAVEELACGAYNMSTLSASEYDIVSPLLVELGAYVHDEVYS